MASKVNTQASRSVRCNCGKVELTVSGKDKLAVHCYCLNCQRSTGSAFAHNHRFSEAEVKIEKGEDTVKQYADGDTHSGRVMYRHFFGNCGSPLFLRSSAVADFVAVHEGSTKEQAKSQPVLELYPEEKYAWLSADRGNYDGPPPFP